MTASEFRCLAMESARCYYRYLDENGLGRSTTRVLSLERAGRGFLLHLSARLPVGGDSLDDLVYEICGNAFNAKKVCPVSYDMQNATLYVQPTDAQVCDLLSSARPEDVVIYSDLKFLVRRVYDWYNRNGMHIHLPANAPTVEPPLVYYGDPPTAEQQAAIRGALSQPFSYVWGAPGTGKTRCVLANCVIPYALSGKRVMLVAPTNNAVEQMLFALLPVLDSAGVSADAVLRLGVPSAEFAKQYPMSCESAGIHRQLMLLDRQIELYQNCLSLRSQAQKISLAKSKLPALFSQIDRSRHAQAAFRKFLIRSQKESASLRLSRREAEREIACLCSEIQTDEQRSRLLFHRIKCFFSASAREAHRQRLQQLRASLDEKTALSASLSEQLQAASRQADILGDLLQREESNHASIRKLIADEVTFLPSLKQYVLDADPLSLYEVLFRLDGIASVNESELEKYAEYSVFSFDELQAKLEDAERERSSVEITKQSRFDNRYVVAATIDRYIMEFSDPADCSYAPDHIFMDEAGYCCMIKAGTLLAVNAPITFLGDHMQLPPVCEVGDEKLSSPQTAPIFLWSQSSIYLEDIFSKEFDEMLGNYLSVDAASFRTLRKYSLTLTHRFGNAIAAILARCVYAQGFSGANPSGTTILVIDAPHAPGHHRRENPSEVAMIARYLERVNPQDYAILTPYRKQASLLSRSFKQAAKEGRVLTVHASQGREWDTVIFSPVDNTPGSLWFTNSLLRKSRGKEVVNTAVSRAKRTLVIVCDRSFWESRPNQLISQLIAASEPQ